MHFAHWRSHILPTVNNSNNVATQYYTKKKKNYANQVCIAIFIWLHTYVCMFVCTCVFFSCQLQLQCLYSYATCHPDPLVYCHFLRIEVTRTNRQTLVILAFQKIKQRVTCAYACAMTYQNSFANRDCTVDLLLKLSNN